LSCLALSLFVLSCFVLLGPPTPPHITHPTPSKLKKFKATKRAKPSPFFSLVLLCVVFSCFVLSCLALCCLVLLCVV
jgi:hypothetical protein